MKKLGVAVLLPITAGLALAGTGFGAWVLSGSVTNKSLNAAYYIENAYCVDFGTATATQVHFDSGNDLGNASPTYFSQTFTLTYSMSEVMGVNSTNGTSVADNTVETLNSSTTAEVTYTVKVEPLNAFKDYISVFSITDPGSTTTNAATATYTGSCTGTANTTNNFTVQFGWKEGKCPGDLNSYVQMLADLSASEKSVTVKDGDGTKTITKTPNSSYTAVAGIKYTVTMGSAS